MIAVSTIRPCLVRDRVRDRVSDRVTEVRGGAPSTSRTTFTLLPAFAVAGMDVVGVS